MLYEREIKKVLATIKRAGASKKCTVSYEEGVDSFSGQGGTTVSMEVYFAQINYDNKELELNPSLVEGIKIVVCPLNDGVIETNFVEICRNKSAKVTLPTGKVMSVKIARLTIPDGVTPILARLSLGG